MPIKPWKDLTISDDYMFKLVIATTSPQSTKTC